MHIAEGMLAAKWAATWYGAAALFVAKGVADLQRKSKTVPLFKPLVALLGAAVFIISLLPIPIPFGGTTAHACGTPLAAILVGPFLASVLSMMALFLQAVFFAHGGLSTLGANVFAMGVVGSLAGFGVFILSRRLGVSLLVAAFMAGLLGDIAVYITTSMQLALSLHGNLTVIDFFLKMLLVFAPAQLPLSILEGLVTAGVVGYVYRARPDILLSLGVIKELPGGDSKCQPKGIS